MSAPAVSVVIPTRNRRSLLAQGLATVLRQTESAIEVFVVDEASSDGTAEYVRGLTDRRVKLVRHDAPEGVAAARNAGLARAQAPWVAFLDDDDLWAPDKLASQLEAARTATASWVVGGAVVIDPKLRVIGGTRPPTVESQSELLAYNLIPGGGSGTLVNAQLCRSMGGFDTELSILADWDMWIRLLLHGGPAAVDRPLVGYMRHSASMSHLNRGLARELDHIERKYADARSQFGVPFSRARWLYWMAQMQLRAGGRRKTVGTYLRLAWEQRDPKSVLRATIGGAFPAFAVRRWEERSLRQLPPGWVEDAESWLAPLRVSVPTS